MKAENDIENEERSRLRRIDALRKIVKQAGTKLIDFSQLNLHDEDLLKKLGV